LFNIFGRSMAGRVGEILRGLAADIDAVETHAAEEASAQLGGMPFDASIAEMVIDGLADAAAWQLALAFDAAPDPHLVFGAEREARRAAARPGAPAGLQRAADLLRVAPGDSFTACLARARGAAPAARDVFGPCPPEVVAFAMYYVAAARECPGDLVEMLAESAAVGRAVAAFGDAQPAAAALVCDIAMRIADYLERDGRDGRDDLDGRMFTEDMWLANIAASTIMASPSQYSAAMVAMVSGSFKVNSRGYDAFSQLFTWDELARGIARRVLRPDLPLDLRPDLPLDLRPDLPLDLRPGSRPWTMELWDSVLYAINVARLMIPPATPAPNRRLMFEPIAAAAIATRCRTTNPNVLPAAMILANDPEPISGAPAAWAAAAVLAVASGVGDGTVWASAAERAAGGPVTTDDGTDLAFVIELVAARIELPPAEPLVLPPVLI
jgi:hypothetical protein